VEWTKESKKENSCEGGSFGQKGGVEGGRTNLKKRRGRKKRKFKIKHGGVDAERQWESKQGRRKMSWRNPEKESLLTRSESVRHTKFRGTL